MATSTKRSPFLGLLGWWLATFAAAAIGAVASIDAGAFYGQLARPPWAPDASVFGPVWTVLYALMGVAAWLVWKRGGWRARRGALSLFLLQLAVNALWSWLFFAWHLGAAAFLEILVLLALAVALQWAGQQAVIEGIVYTGNVTLHAGATPGGGPATLTLREAKNELHVGGEMASRRFVDVNETIQASWTLNSATGGLALILPDDQGQPRTLRFARGASRLHIGNHLNATDGSTVMLFLIRQGA